MLLSTQVREANQMVEEMMLLANVTVAEHVLTHFAACALLRRHAVPPPRQFEPLLRATAAAGLSVDVSTSKVRSSVGFDIFCWFSSSRGFEVRAADCKTARCTTPYKQYGACLMMVAALWWCRWH